MGRLRPSAMQSTNAEAQAAFGNGAASTASSQRNADATQSCPTAIQPEKPATALRRPAKSRRRQLSSGVLDEILIAWFAV